MTISADLDIFLVAVPGLEGPLCAEVRALSFKAKTVNGGVEVKGSWPDVWRLNLECRGASRIIARFLSFRASHLSELDKRARRVPWGEILRRDVPFAVEATCAQSRIYHSGAAAQRIERAIHETLGAPFAASAEVVIKVRIENDICSIGVDTSGEPLHKRGHKEAVAKAPMRETMAALFLRQCGYDGREPVLDPMCGSGTFVIEAAEIAAGLKPGRSRHFAFEKLVAFDAKTWQRLRDVAPAAMPSLRFHGSDRDAGAVRMAKANAERAGVSALTAFDVCDVKVLVAPDGPPGLIMINPPYGERVGKGGNLKPLYRQIGETLSTRFHGWRVGIVTNDEALAKATGLTFIHPSPPVLHGGLRVTLFRTAPLA